MDQRLNLGTEVRELKLGSTFSSNPRTSFHTLKCKWHSGMVLLVGWPNISIRIRDVGQICITWPCHRVHSVMILME